MTGHDLAAAAEALVGTPFRLHGRDADHGLDCVGLVLAALRASGRASAEVAGYQLRQTTVAAYLQAARACGFAKADGAIEPGDLLLVRAGPAQHHLLVASRSGGFIHAHAGLRREVHSPAPLTWPVLRHWRLQDQP